MSSLINFQLGKNTAYVTARFIIIIAFSLAIYALQPRVINSFTSVQDIAIPAIVGVVGAIVVLIMSFMRPIRHYIPFVVLVADWALIAAYTYFNGGLNSILLFSIVGVVILSGTLRIGAIFGLIHSVGALIAFAAAFYLSPLVNFYLLRNNLMAYAPGAALALSMAILANIWHTALDEESSVTTRSVRNEAEEARKRVENMQERAKAFSEMAQRLNETLNYDRILDAALDVGRLSVRDDSQQRVVSVALMLDGDNELEIASERGLHHSDVYTKLAGREGVIADSLDEGIPIVLDGGEYDPELRKLRAFTGIKTTLVIPLRAHYETYGVLVFGTTTPHAINEDHIDTLEAIGVQTAVALRNAVLYENLRIEKERIVKIEGNSRQALVRDLHDIPTQTVSAVAMHLSTLPMIAERKPETLRAEINNIREMALRATEEIRHVMFTLRPLALETQGLIAALKQLAEKMQKTYKQPMQVSIDPRVEDALEQEAKGSLFYLVEEAANNARKYAKASLIQVKGELDGNFVIVRIRDNGKGFDANAVDAGYEKRGSFGMVNMRERAELINATFNIQSAPGKGTQVTVRVPVSAHFLTAASNGNAKQPIPKAPPRRKKQYSGPISPST